MAPIVVLTLADLGPSFWVTAFSSSCFHWGDFDRDRLPPDSVLEELGRRQRGSRCGGGGVLLYHGWDAGGFEVGY